MPVLDVPMVVAIAGMAVWIAVPMKNEPSPASTIIETSTRSLDTSRNTLAAPSTPTRVFGARPPRRWPVNFVRAMSTVSGR